MKTLDEYVDSSDDEEIRDKNPYDGISSVDEKKIRTDLIENRIQALKKVYLKLKDKPLQSVQNLLTNPIGKAKARPGAQRKTSLLSPPLMGVKKVCDSVPSHIPEQHLHENTFIPTYRGISNPLEKGDKLFFLTQSHFKGQHQFSSLAYRMSKLEPGDMNKANFYSQTNLALYKKVYQLPRKIQERKRIGNEEKLKQNAKVIKNFFDLSAKITMIFTEWEQVFPEVRKAKILYAEDPKTNHAYLITLKEILSYIYTSNYKQSLEIFSNFPQYLLRLTEVLNGRADKKERFAEVIKKIQDAYHLLPSLALAKSIPYLSEAQIPRHSLLYAFDVKKYENMRDNAEIKPFYRENLKPHRAYLGKFFISENPHHLFHKDDKPISVVELDKNFSQKLIEKTIIGEMEIQHSGANLQGKIAKAINIKLPKFDKAYPDYYMQKYGLSKKLFLSFKTMFQTLSNDNYGKLGWLYLESVLVAHLIHFHELQIYKYTQKTAENLGKTLLCYDRSGQKLQNMFANP